jgi:hypothetical protein
MVDVFENYLRPHVQLTAEEWTRLQALSSAKHLRKRQFLLHEGQVWQSYAFVCRGCLRQYTIDGRGVEHMLKFSIENRWAGDRESLVTGHPSRQYIDALEDSDVLLFPKADFNQFARDVPAFHAFIEGLLGRTYLASQQRRCGNQVPGVCADLPPACPARAAAHDCLLPRALSRNPQPHQRAECQIGSTSCRLGFLIRLDLCQGVFPANVKKGPLGAILPLHHQQCS